MERGNNVPRNYLGVTEILEDYIRLIPSGVKIRVTEVFCCRIQSNLYFAKQNTFWLLLK